MQASFYPGYEPKVLSAKNNCVFRAFVDNKPYLLMGKMVEVTMRASAPPPTRSEFRAICDQYSTAEAIVAALESR
ncbi:MAG: hypothetical protein HY898_29925 [Deltaproteobacteria bacterium]|nr:hypothetical protein [Deltaproteobacteria bacterium]